MSTSGRTRRAPASPPHGVFAALGDPTRLALVARLSAGGPRSIADLTEGTAITRQAVTKHLRVLAHAGLVRSIKDGRERRFRLDPAPLGQAQRALADLAAQWEDALGRLRRFVERGDPPRTPGEGLG